MGRRKKVDGPGKVVLNGGDLPQIDGKLFLRTLSYALKACPASEDMTRLAHVAFVGNKIVCSDGMRWHVGVLPKECAIGETFIAARESAQELVLGLEYALKISRRHSSQFYVSMDSDGLVIIAFGANNDIAHHLAECEVGYVPDVWEEPVSPDAPPLSEAAELHCGSLKEAMQWYRSWDKDHGRCKLSGKGGDDIVRVDIMSDDTSVACAFLMPTTRPPAYLVHDEPLFSNLNPGRKVGQSILDLQLDKDGAAERPHNLKIGDKEFNIVGLDATPDELVAYAPCIHDLKGDTACAECTSDNVRAARKKQNKIDKELDLRLVSASDTAPSDGIEA